jgi:polysaccharide deacetylase 2 family uncharacterized protein YibQ
VARLAQKANEKGVRQGSRTAKRGTRSRPASGAAPSPARSQRRRKSPAGKRGKPLSLPLFTVWLVALVVLGSVLYWGISGRTAKAPVADKPKSSEPKATAQAKPAEQRPATAPPAAPAAPPAPAAKPPVDQSVEQRTAAKSTAQAKSAEQRPATALPAIPAAPAASVAPPAPAAKPPVDQPVEQRTAAKSTTDEAQELVRPRPTAPSAPAQPSSAGSTPVFEEYRQVSREFSLDRVDKVLNDFLKAEGAAGDQLVRRHVRHAGPDGATWITQEMEARLPADHNLQTVKDALLKQAQTLGPDVLFKAELPKPDRLLVEVSLQGRLSHKLVVASLHQDASAGVAGIALNGNLPASKAKAPPTPSPVSGLPPLGKAAIVIDDLGIDLAMAKALLAIPLPLTFSVMPQQRHSQEIARLAHAQGRGVLVHMPMEPHGYPQVNPGPGALLLSMSGPKLLEAVNTALADVPFADGVNNHMGSTFTEQIEPMKLVLSELHKRGLFFLDSYTTPQSVACSAAAQLHVPCGRRDIFLDHEVHEDFVRSQLPRLIREAKIQGSAVAIGHPHAATLNVLAQEAGRFSKERVAIVSLRELLTRSAARH